MKILKKIFLVLIIFSQTTIIAYSSDSYIFDNANTFDQKKEIEYFEKYGKQIYDLTNIKIILVTETKKDEYSKTSVDYYNDFKSDDYYQVLIFSVPSENSVEVLEEGVFGDDGTGLKIVRKIDTEVKKLFEDGRNKEAIFSVYQVVSNSIQKNNNIRMNKDMNLEIYNSKESFILTYYLVIIFLICIISFDLLVLKGTVFKSFIKLFTVRTENIKRLNKNKKNNFESETKNGEKYNNN